MKMKPWMTWMCVAALWGLIASPGAAQEERAVARGCDAKVDWILTQLHAGCPGMMAYFEQRPFEYIVGDNSTEYTCDVDGRFSNTDEIKQVRLVENPPTPRITTSSDHETGFKAQERSLPCFEQRIVPKFTAQFSVCTSGASPNSTICVSSSNPESVCVMFDYNRNQFQTLQEPITYVRSDKFTPCDTAQDEPWEIPEDGSDRN